MHEPLASWPSSVYFAEEGGRTPVHAGGSVLVFADGHAEHISTWFNGEIQPRFKFPGSVPNNLLDP